MTLRQLLLPVLLFAIPVFAQQRFVGGDISLLQSYEDNKVNYYDQKGNKISNVLQYIKSEEVGWNALRVRLFVDPQQKAPNGSADPQVCQNLDYVVRLCKRIKAEGFTLLLDFHYSDTWADPANQWTPTSWQNLSDAELQAKIYDYTKACLQKLVAENATPDFIQTGNEISYGMLWGKYGSSANRCYTSSTANWPRFIAFLKQATKACREVCPQAQIIIHTERAKQASTTVGIYQKLAEVDYDIIGLSYYPFWHGSLATLSGTLNQLAAKFPDKKVQVVETAYYYQYQPTTSDITDFSSTWPVSKEGQAAFASDLIAELKKHANVNALYWWFPEENGNGPNSKVLAGWINRGLWNNSTHRAHPGLYVLKDYLTDESAGVVGLKRTGGSQRWYTLSGMQLDYRPYRQGFYIHDGRKFLIR